jgi:hypothetical protein
VADPRFDPDHRFDTGMTLREATKRAMAWWSEYRAAVNKDFNTRITRRITPKGPGPMGVVVTKEQDLPDGILSGKKWGDLTGEEQAKIVAQWHHQHVRVPLVAEAQSKLSHGATRQ